MIAFILVTLVSLGIARTLNVDGATGIDQIFCGDNLAPCRSLTFGLWSRMIASDLTALAQLGEDASNTILIQPGVYLNDCSSSGSY
jgi:hypothetical protein